MAFASLVRQIVSATDQDSITKLAARMGWERTVLYSRLANKTRFSAEEINQVLRAFPDARLANYFLEGTKFIAAERNLVEGDAIDGQHPVHEGAQDLITQAATMLDLVRTAVADARIDHRERPHILRELESCERTLASVRMHLGD